MQTINKKIDVNDRHIVWLDTAKGLCIFLVVCNHIGAIPAYLQKYLQFYMPMFFIAAGYTYVYKPLKEFCRQKINRLLKPYIFYNIILYINNCFWVGIGKKENNLLQAINGIFYGAYVCKLDGSGGGILLCIENAPMWFLLAIFNTYLLFWYENKILKQENDNLLKIIWILLFNFGLTKALSYLPILLPWSLDTIFMGASFMFCGKYLRKKDMKKGMIIPLSVIYIVLVNINRDMNYSTRNWGESVLIYYICGVCGSIVCFGICKYLVERFAFLRESILECNRVSVCILCLHLVLNVYLCWILGKLDFPMSGIYRFIQAIVICVMCNFGVRLIKRNPLIKTRPYLNDYIG